MSSTFSPRVRESSMPGGPTLVFPERVPAPTTRAPPPGGGWRPQGRTPGADPVTERSRMGGVGAVAGGGGEEGAAATSIVFDSSSGGRSRTSSSRPGCDGDSQQVNKPASSFVCAISAGGKDSCVKAVHGEHSGRGLWSSLRYRVQQLVGHVDSTPALTAAKTQRTPCGVNRYVLLGVYFFYAFLTARVYFAWPSLSNLLFRSNAYAWLCDPASPDLRLPENGGRRYRCEAQNSQLGSLFVTCLTFAFSCSLLAGVMLDFFGPKITALTGQLCNMLAWLLLAFAGKHAQTYFPAFIFMGIGSDIGYLPILSAANLFPGHEGLVVACLGAAKSLSFAVPAILDIVELHVKSFTLQDVSLGYVAFGPGFCVLLSLLLIPLQAFVPWNEFVYLEEEPSVTAARPLVRVNDSFASYEAHAWRDSFSSFQDVKDWMHHHHLATPLEELTHPASVAALPPLRGPMVGSGLCAPTTAADGGGGSSSSSTDLGQAADGVTGAAEVTGRMLLSPPQGMQHRETAGDATTGGSSSIINSSGKGTGEKEEGAPIPSDMWRRDTSGKQSTAFGTSVSTEAVFASSRINGSSSSAGEGDLQVREEPDATKQLQHPGAAGHDTAAKTNEGGKGAAKEGGARHEGDTRRRGEGPDGGAAAESHGRLLVDTSVHSPITVAAAKEAELRKRVSDLDEAAAGEETVAATTRSETAAAADEEVSGQSEGAGAEEGVSAEEVQATPTSAGGEERGGTAAGLLPRGAKGRGAAAAAQATTEGGERRSNSGGGAHGAPASLAESGTEQQQDDANATPSFRRQFFSKFAFGIVFYSVLKALMYAFLTTGGENLLGKKVNDFMAAALPFSCIPCLLLGKMVDLVGIMPVLLFLNTCITLAFGFSMIPSTVTAYLAALLYICYVSFYSSQSYCYVSDTFSSCHFGKLVGTIHMIAGLLSLLKIPMQSMVVHVFHSNYLYPCVIMLVFCAANFCVLIWLIVLKRRDPHPFWPQSAKDAAAAENARRREIREERKRKRREAKLQHKLQKTSQKASEDNEKKKEQEEEEVRP